MLLWYPAFSSDKGHTELTVWMPVQQEAGSSNKSLKKKRPSKPLQIPTVTYLVTPSVCSHTHGRTHSRGESLGYVSFQCLISSCQWPQRTRYAFKPLKDGQTTNLPYTVDRRITKEQSSSQHRCENSYMTLFYVRQLHLALPTCPSVHPCHAITHEDLYLSNVLLDFFVVF